MDRRRFTGPESSAPLRRKGETTKPRQQLGVQEREDGRLASAARPIYLQTGLVTQASGSAYIETETNLKPDISHGPHPARRDAAFSAEAQLNVEVRFAPFACVEGRRIPGKETEASNLAARLEQTLRPALRLDLLPKSAIDLFVYILECDGATNDISAGVTAASVALASAGVEMFGLVTAATALIAPPTTPSLIPTIIIDPTAQECQKGTQGLLTLACMPALGSVTDLSLQGSVPPAVLAEALKRLRELCDDIHGVAALCLRPE